MRRARVVLLVAVPMMVVAGAAAFVFLRTERALKIDRQLAVQRGALPFELRRLNAHGAQTPFEPVASAASFRAAAVFEGKMYVAGPEGLYVYNEDHRLEHVYQVGMDLPAAGLTGLAVGTLKVQSAAQLLIATAGEGVLLLSSPAMVGGAGDFEQMRPEAPEMRDVTALLPLDTGELMIGTRRAGVMLYSGDGLRVFRPEMAGIAVTALASDGAGGFWVGTRDRGALHWSGGTVESVGVAELPDEQVTSFALRGDAVFVGTPVGVAEVRGGRVVRRLAEGVFAYSLGVTRDGKALEVGTLEGGMVEVPLGASGGRRGIRAAGLNSAKDGEISQLVGVGGDLVAVRRNAVERKTEAGWETVLNAPVSGLVDGNVSALAFGRDGRLWVGYFDHGVDVVEIGQAEPSTALRNDKQDIQSAQHIEDDAVFCVNRLVVDSRRGTMVAATANGLVLFDAQGRERQVLGRRDGLISEHVTDVAMTKRGMALATPAGLTFVDAEGTASVYGFEGLVNNHVYALAVQADGDEMLAGTLGGVSLLADEAVRRNMTVGNSGLRHNWVTAVVAMPDGGWMIGTYGAGVMRLDRDGRFTGMDGMPAASSTQQMVVNPNAMLATSNHVFAGTLGQGLWVWTRSTDRWRPMTQGLPSRNVTALAERAGEIYVGTENGLVRVRESGIDAN